VPFPLGVGGGFYAAIQGARVEIATVLTEINEHPEKKYIVAGHSSGAAISNTIAARASNPSRIKQVILDGFSSPALSSAICWAARGKYGNESRNYSGMVACPHHEIFADSHCDPSSQWCLHFVLINKSAPSDLRDFKNHGYDGCNSNVDWINH
jgi:hypothetical protein